MIDEPILENVFSFDASPSIEKFSIPHVSGIHSTSGFISFSFCEHSKTSSIESSEPKL